VILFSADIGAEDVAAALASNMKLPLIASRISRLVIDVNRPLTSDTLFRLSAEGKPIALNAHLSPEDKQERIDQYWKPYRHDLTATLLDIPAIDLVLSIHSFTPLYEGESRECEIGVLFTDSKKEGQFFMKELLAKGYKTVENEPWPAAICDVLNPITAAGRQCVILEIRNDLASNATFRKRLADDIQGILETLELA
jgi:predicted N-formylglutamate amidohydrolase